MEIEGWEEILAQVYAAQTPQQCWQAFIGCEAIKQLPHRLMEVGATLCDNLHAPWLCNNLCCTNMAGASELQLVGGSSCVCGGCKLAR